MCGIFGVAKNAGRQSDFHIDKIREVLTNLAEESSVRGTDSTGLAIISKDKQEIYKSLYGSDELIMLPLWEQIKKEVNRDTSIVMGHVRFATTGTISIRNAHPFKIGKVIGAHNGVIFNHHSLASKFNKVIEVDSEGIFASINNMEIKDALEKIDGDFSLSFVKEDPEVVYFARETSRPLAMAYWKKARTLFWASTDEILQFALRASGLVLKSNTTHTEIIYSFDTRRFNGSPDYKTEKFETLDWFQSARNYGSCGTYAKSTPLYNNYSTKKLICIGCGEDTWHQSHFCWECRKEDSIYHFKCDVCRHHFHATRLTFDEENNELICRECMSDMKTVDCDFCGDPTHEPCMKASYGYRVCENCFVADYSTGWETV